MYIDVSLICLKRGLNFENKLLSLSSDHLPIMTTINIRPDYRLQQNRQTFTNCKKADWTQFTEDTESAFAQTTIPTDIHTANIIFTNIILMADNHNIPKGKMHSNCRLLPEDIVCKITQRNNIRRATTCDPALNLLNEEITPDIPDYRLQQNRQTFTNCKKADWTHFTEDTSPLSLRPPYPPTYTLPT